jgi:hypothetical protein
MSCQKHNYALYTKCSVFIVKELLRKLPLDLKGLPLYKLNMQVGRGSVVGIATRYGPDGPGIESRWGRDFP